MLESLLGQAATDSTINLPKTLLAIILSFALGIVISVTYMKTNNRKGYSRNFALTLIMTPAAVSVIILIIGSNIARAFSLAGAFSIIRFRSAPGDPRDIAYILFTMAAGLACGAGFYQYAAVFTIVLCLLMAVLEILRFGVAKNAPKLLKVTIPEDLDYEGALDDVLKEYTRSFELKKVRMTDLGSLYELVYTVTMDGRKSQKDFMDALRCRNGNLNITLSMCPETTEY